MKIGLVGYYGWGNYGDELFLEIFREALGHHEIVFFHNPDLGTLEPDFGRRLESVDAVIIGGGDLLIPWYASWLYWDERYLAKPVFIFGIGVPTWGGATPSALEQYRNFLLHPSIQYISCRDTESKRWIEEHISNELQVDVHPDMVLARPFPRRNAQSQTLGVVLRQQPAHEWPHLREVAGIAAAHGLRIKLIMLALGKTLADDLPAIQGVELGDYDVVVRDSLEKLSREISECAFLMSQKFHGIVVAYMSGVPHIALSRADKFVSFLKQTGNPGLLAALEEEALPRKFEQLLYEPFNFSNRCLLTQRARKGLNRLVSLIDGVGIGNDPD